MCPPASRALSIAAKLASKWRSSWKGSGDRGDALFQENALSRKLLDPLFKFPHAVNQIGQLLDGDHLALGLPVRRGRNAQHPTAVRHVAHDARFGATTA